MREFQQYQFKTDAINQLPEKEKLDFLNRLALGESRLDLQFRKRLEDFLPSQPTARETAVTIQHILGLSEEKMEERIQEEKRRAQAAYEKRMQKIAAEENALWENIATELDYKKGKGYERATDALRDLKEMSTFFGHEEAFQQKVKLILEQYGPSQALMRRLIQAGIV